MTAVRRWTSLFLVVAGLVVVLAVGLSIPLPHQNRLLQEVLNSTHLFLFGIIALLLQPLGARALRTHARPHLWSYILAGIIATGIGGLTELIQYFGPRDADLSDFLLDAVGVTAFLLWKASYDSRLAATTETKRKRRPRLFRLVGIILIMLALLPLMTMATAFVARQNRFPVLHDFESYFEKPLFTLQGASIEFVPPPAGWTAGGGERVAEVTLEAGAYPGLTMVEPYPDWRGYSRFCFEVYIPGPDSVKLGLRIDDRVHNMEWTDRFGRALMLAPGPHSICIPLTNVRQSPETREMDMAHIASVWFFIHNNPHSQVIYLDHVRLEK